WSADGKWLYFLSDRGLKSLVKSPWGPRQPEPYFTESTRIYALSLRAGGRFPFIPPDESSEEERPAPRAAKEGAAKTPEAASDAAGLATRLFEVPGVSGNLGGLRATAKHLFFTSRATGSRTKPRLMRLEIAHESPEAKLFVDDPKSWDFSS